MLVSKWVWFFVAIGSVISFFLANSFFNPMAAGIYGGLGLASVTVFLLECFEKKETQYDRFKAAIREMYDLGLFTVDEYEANLRKIRFFKEKEVGKNANK